MAQEQQVLIKAKCKDVTRLLKVAKDLTYDDFCALITNSFCISDFHLEYKDEEGDLVQLGSEVELREALKVAETFGPLRITIITTDNPSLIPSNKAPISSETNEVNEEECVQQPPSVQEAKSLPSGPTAVNSPSIQETLTDPLASLQLKERPRERARGSGNSRQGRKRMGFYASLCNDVAALELGASNPKNTSTECQTHVKPKKKAKHQKAAKYYSSLAEDIAALKLQQGQHDDISTVENTSERNLFRSQREAREGTARETKKGDIAEEVSTEEIKQLSLNEEEPPAWFNRAFDKMSQSVSSRVLDALNGAVIASVHTVNGRPVQSIKRDGATYIHDGITCDGCHQTIVGARYKCGNCPDYDLCELCEAIEGIHDSSHVFLKLRFPGIGIGRKHGVMIPLLKDLIYKSKNVKLAEEQERTMKEVRKKLKQLAKKKREEQVRLKKGERKMKKFKGSSNPENPVCDLELVFLGDGSYPDGTVVAPESEFTKCWKIRNGGNISWNRETKLICMYESIKCRSHEVELPHLQPGEEGTISVSFVAPTEAGQYFSVWRASHGGKNFGSKMWCKIKVVLDESQSDDYESFVDANDVPPASVVSSPPSEETGGQPDEARQELPEIRRDPGQTPGVPEDDFVPNFHGYTVLESTPNVVEEPASSAVGPVDRSCSSPGDSQLEWDTCLIDHEGNEDVGGEISFELNREENDDDLLDIEVISIASSDDFCVVPLPACFNPDIPLSDVPHDPLESPEDDERSVTPTLRRTVTTEKLTTIAPECAAKVSECSAVIPENCTANSKCTTTNLECPTTNPECTNTIPECSTTVAECTTRTTECPPESEVDELRERNLVEFSQSAAAPIGVTNQDGNTVISRGTPNITLFVDTETSRQYSGRTASLPALEMQAISKPVTPQPPSVERNAFMPGKMAASPPGRAVPVVQASMKYPEPPLRVALSIPASFTSRPVNDITSNAEVATTETVRAQPPDGMVLSRSYSEPAVTSQPGAISNVPGSSNQSTSHFASVFVTDTLASAKRALGSVTDTVTTFMSGRDGQVSVTYNQREDRVQVNTPEPTEPMQPRGHPTGPYKRSDMDQLLDMGFGDRQLNERLLKKYNNDVNKVVTELLHETDNDWPNCRHVVN